MIALMWLCLAVSFSISFMLSWWCMLWGRRRGLVDKPASEDHKGHERAVPNTGGVAIFAAVGIPTVASLAGIWLVDSDSWSGWLSAVGENAPGMRSETPAAVAVLIGLAVLHVMGWIDDRRGLGAGLKLCIELAVALVLAAAFEIRILRVLESYGLWGLFVSIGLTVLWLVAITNALNMLDNMDGLAAGVAAIIAGLYLAAAILVGQWFVAAATVCLLGSLIGFLIFNFPPARVFMGDAGSLVIGMLLAVISVRTTYMVWPDSPGASSTEVPGHPGAWYSLLMPLVIFAVPLYDLTSVILIRISRGHSPFVGDHRHFSHRLVQRGMSRPMAVLVILLATVATGLGGVMYGSLAGWQAVLVAAQTLAILLVLALLECGK